MLLVQSGDTAGDGVEWGGREAVGAQDVPRRRKRKVATVVAALVSSTGLTAMLGAVLGGLLFPAWHPAAIGAASAVCGMLLLFAIIASAIED